MLPGQDVAPGDSEDPYTRLLAAAVLPKLATALTNAWEPRDPEPPLRFLEAWAELLPVSVQRHILDSLILPKVLTRMHAWLASSPAMTPERQLSAGCPPTVDLNFTLV